MTAAKEIVNVTDSASRCPIDQRGTGIDLSENSLEVLRARYLKKGPDGNLLETPEQMFRRVARVVAAGERNYGADEQRVARLEEDFYGLMTSGRFLPNSPTLMNAGREMGMLSACFVLPVGDSIEEIFDAVKATALVQRAGGGTGFSFDRLRPTGDYIKSSGGTTSGPISFWKVLAQTTDAIQQGAFRRGANMGMMSITHPDILKFIEAKQDLSSFTNFNISVKITDAWMTACRSQREEAHVVINPRTGQRFVIPRAVDTRRGTLDDLLPEGDYRALVAQQRPPVWTMGEVYDLIVDHAWQTGEPGVVFIDRVNRDNPTPQLGEIEATNPCGEQPLLPYEACNLGSVNLGFFVRAGEQGEAAVDWRCLRATVRQAVHFLDNIIDINHYPLPEIARICSRNRKIGLGVMGFADALFKLGVAYDSDEGVAWGERFMEFVNDEAHQMSEELARERGSFPNWKGSRWDTEQQRPMRNACTTTVAPTGTISIIADCSGGVEPLFSLAFYRNVLDGKKLLEVHPYFLAVAEQRGILSPALLERLARVGSLRELDAPEDLKRIFACAHDIAPSWHIRMQAAFQKHCDNSISKTTNFPKSATREDVRLIYDLAFDSGCKGVTVYRDGCRESQPMALKRSADKQKENKDTAGDSGNHYGTPARTPALLPAVRIRQATPFGHMHVSITVDPLAGRELEVFAQLGKAGDVAMSDLEAICRMVSLFLRSGGSLEAVMDQLEGIGSHLSIPTRDGRVKSLGDALGKTIRKYWQAKERFGLQALLLNRVDFEDLGARAEASGKPLTDKAVTSSDRMMEQYKLKCPECGSGTLRFTEGCVTCSACGFSQC